MKCKRIQQIKAVFEAGPDYCAAHARERFTTSKQVFDFFTAMRDETKEHFVALHLDSKNRLSCMDVVSTGSLSASIVHPREVFKTALLSSAAAVILLHNHPSGDPTPSREDLELTGRLREAGELLGIRVLDHVIVGDGCYVSLADRGLLG
jgi:DNA repair protein RadC